MILTKEFLRHIGENDLEIMKNTKFKENQNLDLNGLHIIFDEIVIEGVLDLYKSYSLLFKGIKLTSVQNLCYDYNKGKWSVKQNKITRVVKR